MEGEGSSTALETVRYRVFVKLGNTLICVSGRAMVDLDTLKAVSAVRTASLLASAEDHQTLLYAEGKMWV